ncbi:MAG TPA: hypothetical protein VKT72_11190 [Candidatus Baltobacteraceae bacterium]|nr:hypothetical protein [Candidatus Baltobacteraceae bacterium]
MRKALILAAAFILASCGRAEYGALMPPQDGSSQNAVLAAASIESTFYAFPELQAGRIPNWPAVTIVNAAGDLYFTARGSFDTVFKLTPSTTEYTETALFQTLGPFTCDTLFVDAAGNVYGTTFDGGKACPSNYGCG